MNTDSEDMNTDSEDSSVTSARKEDASRRDHTHEDSDTMPNFYREDFIVC